MSVPKEHKVWIINNAPADSVKSDTFKLETKPAPSAADLKDGEVILRTESLSNDPAQRTWMDPRIPARRHYAQPNVEGEPVRSSLIGKVVASKSSTLKEGDRVTSFGSWSEYTVASDSTPGVRKAIEIPGQSPYIAQSACGLTGMTAWHGVFGEMKLKPEHTIVVSGAAGAVGSMVVQMAKKVVKCKRVVGIAGGKEKCDWVKSLGADECIDYKDKDYAKKLADAVPDFADRYFDNVGGEITDTMLGLVARDGYICVCGAISGYNDSAMSINNWFNVISMRLTIKGYIIVDHPESMQKGASELAQWVKDGTIQNSEGETVVEAKFEEIPQVWERLFKGQNQGKLITKVI